MNRLSAEIPLLTRHPPPSETGSLVGYLIWLSEVNGYETPRAVLARAGMRSVLDAGIDISKLAALTGLKSKFEKISYHRTKDLKVRLLGHELTQQDLSFRSHRICPECIVEKGFVEAHFDLAIMIACPIHRRILIGTCPGCQNPLSVYRPGLLECKCGSDLTRLRGEQAGDTICDLLDVVRRKVLNLEFPHEYTSGIPAPELAIMPLRSIITLVCVLGRHARLAPSNSQKYEYVQYVKVAAEALSDWPDSFSTLLSRMEPRASADSPLYLKNSGISKLYGAVSRSGAEFVRDLISDYAVNGFGSGSRLSQAKKRQINVSFRQGCMI